jgi:hypothetical protein
MKRFQVFSGEKLIGYSDLEGQDPSMGVALGRFLPSDGYPEVAPVFRTWVRAMAPQPQGRPHDEELLAAYFRQRDALSLSVRTSSGEVVGTEWIHIADYSDDLGDDGYDLSICLDQRSVFERLFPRQDAK